MYIIFETGDNVIIFFLEPNYWSLNDPFLLLSIPNGTVEYKISRQENNLLGIYKMYDVKHVINSSNHLQNTENRKSHHILWMRKWGSIRLSGSS